MLALAAVVLLSVAWLRGAEYDESYTILLAQGTPRPDWPVGAFTAADAWGLLAGHSTLPGIADDLRRTDVHPPLYFWMVSVWRATIGTTLVATRAFSVLVALGALAMVGAIARRVGLPVGAAMLLTLGCYGFVYTGAIARGFALAQLLNLIGVYLLLGRRQGLLAGVLLGAAMLTNYLAAFTAAAILFWVALAGPRNVFARAALGFALTLPTALWFFLAQRASRPDQFPPFEFALAVSRLAQYTAANIFGGLPLYAGNASPFVTGAIAILLLALAVVSWRCVKMHPPIALCAAAAPIGLLTLGVVFNNTPIELRYLAFATPFIALILAGALARRPRLLGCVLAIQAIAIAGLMTRAETMQPQSAATAAAANLAGTQGLVIVPRGNDGVGVVGSVLLTAPSTLRLLLVTPATDPAALRAIASDYPLIVLALLELDDQSRAAAALMRTAFAHQPCWREHKVGVHLGAYENICQNTASTIRRVVV